jgi:predicted lipid-binding transport protein (Tim44 family)
MTTIPSLTVTTQDYAWDPQAIKARVREVFFGVQRAWAQRNPELARDCMSTALYRRHRAETISTLTEQARSVIERVRLVEARVVSVGPDYRDDTQDHFWVFIEGSLTAVRAEDASGQESHPSRNAGFTELWKFVRGAHDWVVDEIEPDAGAIDLVQLHNVAEVLAAAAHARSLRAAAEVHAGGH